MKQARLLVLMVALALLGIAPSARAAFGVEEFSLGFSAADGSPHTQAGSHPFAVTNLLRFNKHITTAGEEIPDGTLRNLEVQLPPGLVGRPTATPRCSGTDFIEFSNATKLPKCANNSAVGVILLKVHYESGAGSEKYVSAPVYNLVPPPGVVQKFGFIALGVPVTLEFKLSEKPPYSAVVILHDVNQTLPVLRSQLILWGDPASPLHDSERGSCVSASTAENTEGLATTGASCPSEAPEEALIRLPTSCSGSQSAAFQATSWEGESAAGVVPIEAITGCSLLGFGATIVAQPTSRAAQSPTGLDFSLNVHDEGLKSGSGLALSDIKKTVVTLPEGMTANPSLAEGLNVCSEEALARETASSAPGEGCPNESKIGTVEVETPLLEEPLKGSLYIATPYQNPFNSLLALYFVIKDPALGIVIKQPAHVEPDPVTGRLVTVVENIPQLPFSHFTLHFREGSRSPLVTPPACGAYEARAELFPWSGGSRVTTSSMFQIVSGKEAGPCPVGGVPPFAPEASTGTLNNNAGNYSALDLRISRKDGEQELTRFSTTLPPGLTGNLSGIPFCPDSAIETAKRKTGTQEQSEPSCPAASEIGHTLVGAGVGGVLAWAPGKIYLAGPYNGSPLSVVSITAAKVGPFDLGTVVIRFGLHIDPNTAQVSIDSTGSDPIPHIIDGIVVNVREIHAYVDRSKFILNPTNCSPMGVQNVVSGAGANLTTPADDVQVTLNSPFQAADCANLSFKPSFAVSTSGKTSKANGASLIVKLAYPNAPQGTQSNIHLVKVELPKQLPSRLTTLQKACTAAQFHANPAGCPAASVVGHAKAITPILPVPLEGPAYFVSNGGEAFPNLIMVLQGYGITIDLVGSTFISKAGITSSTFKTVPDQPVTSFELVLPQGPYSALTANGSLCASRLSMPTEMIGQNGMLFTQSTKVNVTGCPKTKTLTRAQKLALALKACHKKPRGAKRKACERQARKKYGPVVKKAKRAKKKK